MQSRTGTACQAHRRDTKRAVPGLAASTSTWPASAGAIYSRCQTGTERRVMAADMDTQVNDFTTAIASTCKGL